MCYRGLAAAQEPEGGIPGSLWEWLSLRAQRSCRRGAFSGAGEAQSFPQRFQLCGCPRVHSKGSVEEADPVLEAQQGHWGQTKQKNQVSRFLVRRGSGQWCPSGLPLQSLCLAVFSGHVPVT
uniref:Uncharacterized protein n=1 Tax=Cyanistes caeruleus TaxID=156563 RepID=A0A8C0VWU2_CYACU